MHKKLIFIFMLFFTIAVNAQWVQTNGPYGGTVNCFAVSDTNLFAGTSNGVYLSTNNGTSWAAVNTGLTNITVISLAISPTETGGMNVFAGTQGNGVFLSTNNGTSWTAVNTGLTNTGVNTLAVSRTNLFAGTNVGVYLSTNNGTNWTDVNTGLTNTHIFSLAVDSTGTGGTNIFAGTYDDVFLSTNNGTSWTEVKQGMPYCWYISSLAVSPNGTSGTYLFAGTYYAGVDLSTDNGTSWTAVNTGLTNTTINSLAFIGTNVFAGTEGNGVFLSTNNGTNWTAVNNGLTISSVLAFAIRGTNIFAGTYDGVFLSTNNGTSWTAVNTGLTNAFVQTLAVSSTNLLAGTNGSGVWMRPLLEMIQQSGDVDGNVSNGPDAYSASLVLKYLADLDTLSAQQLAYADVDKDGNVTANDAYWILYATAYGTFPDGSLPKADGVQMGSVIAGQISSQENSNLVTMPIMLEKSQGIHACYLELNIDGRYADVDNVTGSLPHGWLMVHNYVNGVLKIAMAGITPLKDGTIATISLNLKDKNVKFNVSGSAKLNANLNSQIGGFTVKAVPGQFDLSQNYPNPFNPSTTIKYNLAQDSRVGLTVYDILGQKVKTLVNGLQQAGYYNITWDGNNEIGSKAASGIYIYRLQSGNFIKTLKMNLLK